MSLGGTRLSALPIPQPLPDDDEDVHWALSTASALWARGEAQEALKWLRRAAETASDQNNDERALVLFKAAAECTAHLSSKAPGASPAASVPQPGPTSQPPPRGSSFPPPQPEGPRASAPPPLPHRSSPPPLRRGDRASLPPGSMGPVSAMAPTAAAPPAKGPSTHPTVQPMSRGPSGTGGGSTAGPGIDPNAPLPRGGKTLLSGSVRDNPNVTQAKTLASNAGFEQALARAQAAVNESHTRATLTGATRTPTNAPRDVGRATSLGIGPHDAAATGAQPPPADEKERSPKSGRRNTRTGRRSNPSIGPSEPSTAAPQTTAPEPATQPFVRLPGGVTTKRFEDEVTVEHERAPVVVRFDDLDEKTNVLTNVPVPDEAPPPSAGRRRRTATDPAATRVLSPKERAESIAQSMPPQEDRRSSSEPPPSPGMRDISRITAFRVALVTDAERGTVEVLPLVPNEPAPAGLVTAILVPVDGTSSAQIADILGRRRRGS
jgi:hypothetical protein